jgi:xanthine/uracil permease
MYHLSYLTSVDIFYSTCSTFPEHSRRRRPKEIYLFRVLKCSRSFLPIIIFVLLMMPHVGPMIRQSNVFYSILHKMFISGSFRISWLVVLFPFFRFLD